LKPSSAKGPRSVKIFHVYLHPARGYEAVKEGVCLPALFFNVFWLLFRGLLAPAGLTILCGALLVGAQITAGRNAIDEVQAWGFRLLMVGGVLVVWLLPFFHGNQWRHANLLRRGFAHVTCVTARTPDDAIARALSMDAPASQGAKAGEREERPERRRRQTVQERSDQAATRSAAPAR
jgi:hypothetical protein